MRVKVLHARHQIIFAKTLALGFCIGGLLLSASSPIFAKLQAAQPVSVDLTSAKNQQLPSANNASHLIEMQPEDSLENDNEQEAAQSHLNIVAFQIEPQTGQVVFQSKGNGIISPFLDLSNLPKRAVLTIQHATLDEAAALNFAQQRNAWIDALQAGNFAVNELSLKQVQEQKQPAVQLEISFKAKEMVGSSSDRLSLMQPRIIQNTGAILTLGLRESLGQPASVKQAGFKKDAIRLPSSRNDVARTVSLYQSFADLDPSAETNAMIDGRVRQAWNDFLAGNYPNAVLALNPYLDRVPEDTGARYLLATIYTASGETQNAERELKRLLLQNQQSLPLLLNLVQLKLQAMPSTVQSDQELTQLLQQGLKKWPNQPALLYAQIQQDIAANNLETAKASLIDLIDKEPACEAYYITLGDIETTQGNLQAARVAYWDALSLSPTLQVAREKLGLLEIKAGQDNQALSHFTHTLSPQWLLQYSDLLQATGNPQASLAALKLASSALEDAPLMRNPEQSKDILYRLGTRLSKAKETAGAQRSFQQFLNVERLQPDTPGTAAYQRLEDVKAVLQVLGTAPSSVSLSKTSAATLRPSKKMTVKKSAPLLNNANQLPLHTIRKTPLAKQPVKTIQQSQPVEASAAPPADASVKENLSFPEPHSSNSPSTLTIPVKAIETDRINLPQKIQTQKTQKTVVSKPFSSNKSSQPQVVGQDKLTGTTSEQASKVDTPKASGQESFVKRWNIIRKKETSNNRLLQQPGKSQTGSKHDPMTSRPAEAIGEQSSQEKLADEKKSRQTSFSPALTDDAPAPVSPPSAAPAMESPPLIPQPSVSSESAHTPPGQPSQATSFDEIQKKAEDAAKPIPASNSDPTPVVQPPDWGVPQLRPLNGKQMDYLPAEPENSQPVAQEDEASKTPMPEQTPDASDSATGSSDSQATPELQPSVH